MLEGSFSDAIVKCFTNDEISSDAFENFLEPLQKIVRLSPAVASCLARREIFARTVQKLQIKKPIVRVSLLRIIRDICEATEDRCAVLLRSSNLTESLHRMQQDQVLVKEIASELLKFAEGPCIRSPMRRSSSSTLNHAGQYPPLSLPLNSQQPIRSSYFDQSPALLSPRSRPRTSVSSVASSISTSSISTTASLSNKTPTSIRPVSRDSNSGSAPGTGSTGLGGSGPKSRLPRTSATRIGRLSAGQQARPDGNQKEENVTPTHKPWGGGTGGSTSTAVPKPSPAVNPRRTRRQTSGGEVRRYT